MLTRLRRMFGSHDDETKAVEFAQSWVDAMFGGTESESGAQVSTATAMRVTAFHRAVMVIADGIAQLPVELHRRTAAGIEPAADHPLYLLTTFRPNGFQDASEWIRTTVMHAAATGNAVSYRNEDGGGNLRELIPIRPEFTLIDTNTLLDPYYDLTFENGQFMGGLPRSKVFHLRAPSWDSYRGLDPVSLGKEALGLAQITEKTQAKLHKNGLRPSGLFTMEGKTTAEQREDMRKVIAQMYSGVDNTGKPVIASDALKFNQVQVSGVDAQHLDTRKHQIEEIGRLMGVFTIMLGHAGDQSPTFASAEAFFEAHVRYTLQPWIMAFTSALNTQLLTAEEWIAGYRFRIDTSELLRGSLEARTKYYQAALGTSGSPGWLDPDEVREDDGWNPRGLKTVWVPVGMQTTEQAEAGDAGNIKASDDSFTPTEEMAAEARRGLEWREEYGRGGTAIGVARARDISNRRALSADTVMRMVSYFARHEVDKQGQGWAPGQDGYPSAGKIAWLLWGGDAGRAWANRIARELNEDE